jgi:hypothetical protein
MNSPKVNVFAAVLREKLYGPFLFIESTVTGIIYLVMLREWLLPKLQDIPDIPTTLHEIKARIRGSCANTDQEFSTTCGRRLNIGLMLIKPLMALTFNFINDKLLFINFFNWS